MLWERFVLMKVKKVFDDVYIKSLNVWVRVNMVVRWLYLMFLIKFWFIDGLEWVMRFEELVIVISFIFSFLIFVILFDRIWFLIIGSLFCSIFIFVVFVIFFDSIWFFVVESLFCSIFILVFIILFDSVWFFIMGSLFYSIYFWIFLCIILLYSNWFLGIGRLFYSILFIVIGSLFDFLVKRKKVLKLKKDIVCRFLKRVVIFLEC